MKKVASCIAAVCMFMYGITLIYAENESKFSVQIYVSPNGDDINSGSPDAPLKSIEKARLLAREYNKDSAVDVILCEGRYELKRSLKFNSLDSGISADMPVTYRAKEGETVIVTGEERLDESCFYPVTDRTILSRVISNKAKSNLYVIDTKALGIELSKELMIGENRISGYNYGKRNPVVTVGGICGRVAKWPDEHYVPIGEVYEMGTVSGSAADCTGMRLTLDNQRARLWQRAEDAYIYSQWKTGWQDQSMMITNVTADGVLTTDMPIKGREVSNTAMLMIYNLPEEISVNGEFWADRKNKKIYFMAENTENIGLITLDSEILKVDNARNMIFKDIVFSGSRSNGVSFSKCQNVLLDGCTIENVGGQAFSLINDCTDCGIKNSMVNNVFNGVYLAQNGYVYNCEIKNFGGECYARGISAMGNCSIKNNTIFGSDHLAMEVSGKKNIIEYNDISKVVSHTGDMGAIYYNCPDADGNIIRNNYFHDLHTRRKFDLSIRAIHLDNGTSGVTVENNYFENIDGHGVVINGGCNKVCSNVFKFVSAPISASQLGDLYSGIEISDNVSSDTTTISSNGLTLIGINAEEVIGYGTNLYTDELNIFADFKNRDFSVISKPYGKLTNYKNFSIVGCGKQEVSAQ